MDREIPLVARAGMHRDRTAVRAAGGTATYSDLVRASAAVAARLLHSVGDLAERRVALLSRPGFEQIAAEWGIWRAGGVVVPLSPSHTQREWEHVFRDSGADLVVTDAEAGRRLLPTVRALDVGQIEIADALATPPASTLPAIDAGRRATILYTSGTTSRPKGVVSTHANIRHQIESLVTAWEWSPEDRILLVLPMHHVHGRINVVGCALWSGAICDLLPRFDAEAVWRRFAESELTLFMAVPTIYAKLAAAWRASPPARRRLLSAACARLRLMVSGSAALPVRLFDQWRAISGHVLLERYGMTEIGMALSNPLRGERRAGCVGTPLPGVEVRLVDEEDRPVAPGTPGEIQIRGKGVFLEYWGQNAATRDAFRDGWFRTGDVAVVDRGAYRILGRQSVDIVKTGGYKVSALEIEEVLRDHPGVAECAVVGVPDEVWGQRVAVAVVCRPEATLDLDELRSWAGTRLADYKVPSRLRILDALPRNAMGKVMKPELAREFVDGTL